MAIAGDLVIDGAWTIVRQTDAADAEGVRVGIRQAAEVLSDVLAEALDIKVPVVTAEHAPASSGRRIFIGGRLAERAGVLPADFKGWEWGIAEKDGDLYFFGRDRAGAQPEWPHGCFVPSALAVARFMQQDIGVLFVMPGRIGREVPKLKRLAVPSGLSRRGSVKVEYQTGRSVDFVFNIANNIFGVGAFHTYGGHTYPVACPKSKYFKDHPEYFAMDKKGKRYGGPDDGHAANCISNPDFQKLLYDEMLSRYDAGAEVCQLAQNDGESACHCEACKNLYGVETPWSEKTWLFHRDIAARILKDRPGKLVNILSYGATASPPKTFKVFPGNVLIEICNYEEADMHRWDGYTVPHGFAYYIYNWGWYPLLGFTPKRSIAGLVDQVKRFDRYGIKGVYRCGYGEMYGMEGPAYWVYNHLMADPELDVPACLSAYYRGAFGPAAEPMRRFYEDLEAPLSEVEKMNSTKMSDLVESTIKRTKERGPIRALSKIYTEDRVARMDAALKDARQTPGLTDKHLRRLQLVRTEWNYVRNIGSIAWRYERFLERPTLSGRDGLFELIEERKAMIERLFPGGKIRSVKDWPELLLFGYPPLGQFKVNGRLLAKIDVPLNWDIEKMRRFRIVPNELMTPEERRREMLTAGLRPLKGFTLVDKNLKGTFFEPYPDGTGFRFGQGTNEHVRVVLNVGAKQGFLPGKTYRITWLTRWKHVQSSRVWKGFYFSALFAPKQSGDWRRYSVQQPGGATHFDTAKGWTRESVVLTVCDEPGFTSDLTFRFYGSRDGVAEVRDLTLEEMPEVAK